MKIQPDPAETKSIRRVQEVSLQEAQRQARKHAIIRRLHETPMESGLRDILETLIDKVNFS